MLTWEGSTVSWSFLSWAPCDPDPCEQKQCNDANQDVSAPSETAATLGIGDDMGWSRKMGSTSAGWPEGHHEKTTSIFVGRPRYYLHIHSDILTASYSESFCEIKLKLGRRLAAFARLRTSAVGQCCPRCSCQRCVRSRSRFRNSGGNSWASHVATSKEWRSIEWRMMSMMSPVAMPGRNLVDDIQHNYLGLASSMLL